MKPNRFHRTRQHHGDLRDEDRTSRLWEDIRNRVVDCRSRSEPQQRESTPKSCEPHHRKLAKENNKLTNQRKLSLLSVKQSYHLVHKPPNRI